MADVLRRYYALGLRRSGNHAVLEWLIRALRAEVVHFNNVKFVGLSLYRGSGGSNVHLYDGTGKKVVRHGHVHPSQLKNVPFQIVSMEDQTIQKASTIVRHPKTEEVFGSAHNVKKLVIVRSIYNVVASRLQAIENGTLTRRTWDFDESILDLWLDHACADSWDDPWCRILYDHWHSDTSFQRRVSRWLSIRTTAVQSEESRFGGGPSFPNQPHTRDQRWERVKLPHWLLTDSRVALANLNLFGWYLDKNQNKVTQLP